MGISCSEYNKTYEELAEDFRTEDFDPDAWEEEVEEEIEEDENDDDCDECIDIKLKDNGDKNIYEGDL